MFKLGRMTDYAVGLTTLLARAEGTTFRAPALAREAGLPDATAAKLLKALTQAGILVSHRGPRGGYTLARPAAEVTVGDVVRAVEGPVALTDCLDAREGCERHEECAVRPGLERLNGAVRGALDRMSLAEMAVGEPPAADEEARHVRG